METHDAAVAPTSRSLTVDVDSFVTPRMTANSPAADRRGSTSSDSSNDSASSSSTEAINAVVSPAERKELAQYYSSVNIPAYVKMRAKSSQVLLQEDVLGRGRKQAAVRINEAAETSKAFASLMNKPMQDLLTASSTPERTSSGNSSIFERLSSPSSRTDGNQAFASITASYPTRLRSGDRVQATSSPGKRNRTPRTKKKTVRKESQAAAHVFTRLHTHQCGASSTPRRTQSARSPVHDSESVSTGSSSSESENSLHDAVTAYFSPLGKKGNRKPSKLSSEPEPQVKAECPAAKHTQRKKLSTAALRRLSAPKPAPVPSPPPPALSPQGNVLKPTGTGGSQIFDRLSNPEYFTGVWRPDEGNITSAANQKKSAQAKPKPSPPPPKKAVFDRLTHEHNFTGAHRAKLESGAQEEFLLRSFLHGSFD